jgi:hypothetical protein
MPACTISPSDRRAQLSIVGNDLIKNYGKKRYYSIEEVKQANRRKKIDPDYLCWSHAAFNLHAEFDAYHRSLGEECDYAAMKSEMLLSISSSEDSSWFDIDLPWFEFPDIDLSVFDFLDWTSS